MVEPRTLLAASNNRPEEFQHLVISPGKVQPNSIWEVAGQGTATPHLIDGDYVKVTAHNHPLLPRERNIQVLHKSDFSSTLLDASNPTDMCLHTQTARSLTEEIWEYGQRLLDRRVSSWIEEALPDVVVLFSEGLESDRPARSVIDMAAQITTEAEAKTVQPEITVDVDGALSFDLRLSDGRLVLAELSMDGVLDASIYDDDLGISFTRLPQATASELIAYF